MDRTPTLCIGLIADRERVDAAIDELRRLGVSADEVSAIVSGREAADRLESWEVLNAIRTAHVGDRRSSEVMVGGLSWLALEAGALLVPMAGYVLAVGWAVAGLIGSTLSVIHDWGRGTLAESLTDLGMSEEEARYHERRVGQGTYLIVVNCTRWPAARIREILLRHGAEDRQPPQISFRERFRRRAPAAEGPVTTSTTSANE